MLVVTRKPGTKIKLSNGVIIHFIQVEGNRIKVGVEAPNDIGIKRSKPCSACKEECFNYYLDYPDIPVCDNPVCQVRLKEQRG